MVDCYLYVIFAEKCQHAIIVAVSLECAMFEEARARMSQNGRIVIPAAFRKALGVDDGDDLVLRLQDGELRITTLQRRIQRAQERSRRYVKPGSSPVDELLRDRREAAKRE
jgi:AbrB family looped-hinge helix DNA binding protein